MKITFYPIRSDAGFAAIRSGEALILNGTRFDFADLAEGDSREMSDMLFCAPVTRRAGQLELHLLLPHGAEASEARRFPRPIEMAEDGEVPLP